MSTKIAIFREGIIIQVAPPLELYNNPCNLYVADFIGNPRINFVDAKATVDGKELKTQGDLGSISFPCTDMTKESCKSGSFDVVLGVRPEQVSLYTKRQSTFDIEGKIYTSMPAGSETLVTVKVKDVNIVVKELGITYYNPDQTVYLSIDPKKTNVFDKKSEELIKYSL